MCATHAHTHTLAPPSNTLRDVCVRYTQSAARSAQRNRTRTVIAITPERNSLL